MYKIKRKYSGLGKYLARARVVAGYSQTDIAKKLKYSSGQFISNFECGIARPPTEKLTTLISLYNLDKEALVRKIMREEKAIVRKALCSARSL